MSNCENIEWSCAPLIFVLFRTCANLRGSSWTAPPRTTPTRGASATAGSSPRAPSSQEANRSGKKSVMIAARARQNIKNSRSVSIVARPLGCTIYVCDSNLNLFLVCRYVLSYTKGGPRAFPGPRVISNIQGESGLPTQLCELICPHSHAPEKFDFRRHFLGVLKG